VDPPFRVQCSECQWSTTATNQVEFELARCAHLPTCIGSLSRRLRTVEAELQQMRAGQAAAAAVLPPPPFAIEAAAMPPPAAAPVAAAAAVAMPPAPLVQLPPAPVAMGPPLLPPMPPHAAAAAAAVVAAAPNPVNYEEDDDAIVEIDPPLHRAHAPRTQRQKAIAARSALAYGPAAAAAAGNVKIKAENENDETEAAATAATAEAPSAVASRRRRKRRFSSHPRLAIAANRGSVGPAAAVGRRHIHAAVAASAAHPLPARRTKRRCVNHDDEAESAAGSGPASSSANESDEEEQEEDAEGNDDEEEAAESSPTADSSASATDSEEEEKINRFTVPIAVKLACMQACKTWMEEHGLGDMKLEARPSAGRNGSVSEPFRQAITTTDVQTTMPMGCGLAHFGFDGQVFRVELIDGHLFVNFAQLMPMLVRTRLFQQRPPEELAPSSISERKHKGITAMRWLYFYAYYRWPPGVYSRQLFPDRRGYGPSVVNEVHMRDVTDANRPECGTPWVSVTCFNVMLKLHHLRRSIAGGRARGRTSTIKQTRNELRRALAPQFEFERKIKHDCNSFVLKRRHG
jgi:hypothetical protein